MIRMRGYDGGTAILLTCPRVFARAEARAGLPSHMHTHASGLVPRPPLPSRGGRPVAGQGDPTKTHALTALTRQVNDEVDVENIGWPSDSACESSLRTPQVPA